MVASPNNSNNNKNKNSNKNKATSGEMVQALHTLNKKNDKTKHNPISSKVLLLQGTVTVPDPQSPRPRDPNAASM